MFVELKWLQNVLKHFVRQAKLSMFTKYLFTLNSQFLQIQSVLENTGEENQEDLVKLRDDLVELIHVSEGI